MRVVVFCEQAEQVKAAQDAGADEVGAEDLAKKIQGGGRISTRRSPRRT